MYHLTQGTTGKVHPKCSLHWPGGWACDVPLRRLEPAATAASLKLAVRHSNGRCASSQDDVELQSPRDDAASGAESEQPRKRLAKQERDGLARQPRYIVGVCSWSRVTECNPDRSWCRQFLLPSALSPHSFIIYPHLRSSFKRPLSRPARAGRSHCRLYGGDTGISPGGPKEVCKSDVWASARTNNFLPF